MGMFFNMGIDITPRLRAIEFLKDVPARAMKAAGKEAIWFSVAAGKPLYLAGEPADTLSCPERWASSVTACMESPNLSAISAQASRPARCHSSSAGST